MSLLDAVLILLAGVGAGAINAVVGSGTLITFPTLLALGVPPVTANMSNSLGLVPGSIAGAVGYRRELSGQRARLLRMLAFSSAGGVLGAVLLLVLPPDAFEAVVPVLILLGIALVALQPRLNRWVARRAQERAEAGGDAAPVDLERAWWVPIAIFGTGVYGGYFGAAQGVLLMGILGIGVADALQRLNGIKNVLVATVNAIAGIIFVVVAQLGLLGSEARVDWSLVGLIAVGAVCGGFLGASLGRRLPPTVLRAVIVAVGLVAVALMLFN